MNFTTHIPIQYYYDKQEEICEAASWFIRNFGISPAWHPGRFTFVGSYQCNQNEPYVERERKQIVRKYYNGLQILMEV